MGWKYIQGYIIRSLKTHARQIRVPEHIYERGKMINEAWSKLAQETTYEPQVEEVATELKEDTETIKLIEESLARKIIPLVMENNSDEDYAIVAVDVDPLPDEVAIANELSARVNELLASDRFSRYEALIIKAKHLTDSRVSSARLGEVLGISRATVDAIEKNALTKFRSADIRDELMDYYS